MHAPPDSWRPELKEAYEELRRVPGLILFGSARAGKASPFDLDCALIDPSPEAQRQLIGIRRRYSWRVDGFILKGNLLMCFAPEQTTLIRAHNSRSLTAAIREAQAQGAPRFQENP